VSESQENAKTEGSADARPADAFHDRVWRWVLWGHVLLFVVPPLVFFVWFAWELWQWWRIGQSL
jgi:type VI protein secretion system component VasF